MSHRSSNPFYASNAISQSEQRFLGQFKFHSNYEDRLLGRCNLLENVHTKELFLAKDFEFSNELEFEQQLTMLLARKDHLVQ